MNYWPWWVSGVALATVMIFHWFAVGRMMAVSGRFSALIDRVRYGAPAPAPELDEAELLAALQGVTEEEFGESGLPPEGDSGEEDPSDSAKGALQALANGPRPTSQHLVFFATLVLGGLLSSLLRGDFAPSWGVRGELAAKLLGEGDATMACALLGGGILVGFGTRMAGGCTSGHGLCGVSRFQPGSLVSTACFFGAGIALSVALEFL